MLWFHSLLVCLLRDFFVGMMKIVNYKILTIYLVILIHLMLVILSINMVICFIHMLFYDSLLLIFILLVLIVYLRLIIIPILQDFHLNFFINPIYMSVSFKIMILRPLDSILLTILRIFTLMIVVLTLIISLILHLSLLIL